MSYATELAKINRKKITLVQFDLDYCGLDYNVGLCTPDPLLPQCYKTHRTCAQVTAGIHKTEFTPNKITKTYNFSSCDIIPPFNGYRPYLKSYQLLPQEIKDSVTVKNRVSIEMWDDNLESDIDNDPYRSVRGHTSVEVNGSYFKRLFARNPNFRYHDIRIYEGFEGITESEFKLRFTGKLDNVQFNQGVVKFECIDNLKFLDVSTIETKLAGKLAVDIGHTQTTGISVTSAAGMAASNGEILVDDEIIGYQSLSGNTLVSVTRGFCGILTSSHQQGAELTKVHKYYGNPFSIMRDILDEAGVSYDADSFTEIIGNHTYTLEPDCLCFIVTDTKRSELFWELVDQLGCKVWLNESGLVQIRRNIFYAELPSLPSYLSTQVTITDDQHIIDRSPSIDWDDKSRYTRIYFYWDLKIYNAKRALAGYITDDVTIIPLTSVDDLPAQGEVIIGSEFILYAALNLTTLELTGCNRGYRGSSYEEHSMYDAVYQSDLSALKEPKDSKSYYTLDNISNSDAEDAFGTQEIKTIYSRLFNTFAQYAPISLIISGYAAYITALTVKMLASLVDAKNKYAFQLEIKDEALKIGDFHLVTSDDFNEVDGTDFTAKQFQVVKKEISEGNKIKYISEKVISYD